MNNIQNLCDQILQSIGKQYYITIEYSYKKNEDNIYVPYTFININKMNSVVFIDDFGNLHLEKELNSCNIPKDWHECYAGGYETNIEESLQNLLNLIKKHLKGK